ncbi:hypothetical protein BDZ94DRAFT_1288371 [Collybia nuda]|uniref:Uncharacterized protein n=1 Tax=Collybia nuda TaxID=64659 RepID=A0A9P5YBU2_9AGAR|nr:hypothetical protein BDZ94DRAFT_1288371 [Collybia nuda]
MIIDPLVPSPLNRPVRFGFGNGGFDTPFQTFHSFWPGGRWAHQHAANADDHLANGLLIPAMEEHVKAAEAYLAAIERSNDDSAKRTLRLLYNEHCKAVKDLQRKIDKLKEEGKDPTLPQKLDRLPPSTTSNSRPQYGVPRSAPSPPPQRPMYESQNMVDESFMLLAGQRSDPGDAFNQFWNIMQGMLDNLSQPVAFATVPLGNESNLGPGTKTPPRRDGSLSSDTDVEEPMLSRFTRRIGMNRDGHSTLRGSSLKTTSTKPDEDFDDGVFDDDTIGDDLSESFLLIPTGNEMSPSALRKENISLKQEIGVIQKRLEATERVLQLRKEQDTHLRDSIFQATREAQRAMGASMVVPRSGGLDFSGLNLNVSPVPLPGINSGREAQYARRVKELEEELRGLRIENEKNARLLPHHKAMIVKFRERWEKLKESAKRKKEAKAAAGAATSSVREKIVEEPEVEEELDNAGV